MNAEQEIFHINSTRSPPTLLQIELLYSCAISCILELNQFNLLQTRFVVPFSPLQRKSDDKDDGELRMEILIYLLSHKPPRPWDKTDCTKRSGKNKACARKNQTSKEDQKDFAGSWNQEQECKKRRP